MDLLIAGDIRTILEGRVTKEVLKHVSMENVAYALGGGQLPQVPSIDIGETIIMQGKGHIFTSKGAWEGSDGVNVAFLMGIEKKPKERVQIDKPMTVRALYEELAKKYKKGFVIVGNVHFSKLSQTNLQLAPIYHENVIGELHDKYWHNELYQNKEAQLFGVVLKEEEPRAFYHNPNEKGNEAVPSHTHVLSPLARHLLTDSELISGTFWVEAIDSVKTLP